MKDVLVLILSLVIAYVCSILIRKVCVVKNPRKIKYRIARERMYPCLDEIVRISIAYMLLAIGTGMEIFIFGCFVSDKLLKIIEYMMILYWGVVIVIFCYSTFDYGKWTFIPRFSRCIQKVRLRKIVLYSIIAILSIVKCYYNYVLEADIYVFELLDSVYIMSIFAFERVVNIIYEIKIEK